MQGPAFLIPFVGGVAACVALGVTRRLHLPRNALKPTPSCRLPGIPATRPLRRQVSETRQFARRLSQEV